VVIGVAVVGGEVVTAVVTMVAAGTAEIPQDKPTGFVLIPAF